MNNTKTPDKQKAKDLILKELFSGKKHKDIVIESAVEGAKEQNRMLSIQECIKALSHERENILRFRDTTTRTSIAYEHSIEDSLDIINEQINLLIAKL